MTENYLVRWDRAKQAIIEAHSVDELKLIRDQAEAYRYALRLAGEAPEIIRKAEEIKVRAERRAGELLINTDKDMGGRPPINLSEPRTSLSPSYTELGIDRRDAAIWQKIASIPEEKFEQYIATEPEITTAGALRVAKGTHVSKNSGDNEWYTPVELIEAARKVLEVIDLDPASHPDANKIIKADRFYSIENDGLGHEWHGKIWMNPPYAADMIGKFTNKLVKHYEEDDIDEAIVLTNNATETKWFQEMLQSASAICFPANRIKFWSPEKSPATPLQGQAIFYFGKRAVVFAGAFEVFGQVLYA